MLKVMSNNHRTVISIASVNIYCTAIFALTFYANTVYLINCSSICSLLYGVTRLSCHTRGGFQGGQGSFIELRLSRGYSYTQ
jgi:hypothetical protein